MNNPAIFYYFACNIGSESFLKEEIKKFYPGLTFSFSKKGFLTFKSTKKVNLDEVVFCRFYGEFVKKGNREVIEDEIKRLKLNCYELDSHFNLISSPDEMKYGVEYLEMIPLENGDFYLGKFKAGQFNRYISEELPEEAPSRAYLKIVEAAKKLNIQFLPNETALEIGSSPGGATYALLKQDLNVIGVDPGVMAAICLENKKFKHYQKSIQEFDTRFIAGKKIDWLLVDMNLAPEASLNEITKIFNFIHNDFKGAFLTLKMTKIELVSKIPFYIKIITRLNLNPVLLTQLPSHKQEFLLYVERN